MPWQPAYALANLPPESPGAKPSRPSGAAKQKQCKSEKRKSRWHNDGRQFPLRGNCEGTGLGAVAFHTQSYAEVGLRRKRQS